MLHLISLYWLHLTAIVDVLVALVASAHVVLTKRDTRAAIAWVGLIWLTPLIGAMLYLWLGINRIQRRARLLRSCHQHPEPTVHQETCHRQLLDE
ncbi:MAG: PLDc N-terminal domain-containing protein, partial [Planctomycetota bacterium]